MTEERLDAFLDGDRPDDVALYLSAEAVSNLDSLRDRPVAHPVDDGVVLVVDGETGRSVFERFTGQDAMTFAGEAMGRDGHVAPTLDGGTCPGESEDVGEDIDDGEKHSPRFVFAFTEAQNEDVGGMYARGPVLHAYAQCSCGTAYSEKWVVGEH
ncbi:MAG: DUF5807 family protein [Halanaeroarchaeum sp.]